MQQRGSALIYILIAIALLAALTMAFVEPSGQQSRAQNSYKQATDIKGQAELIRAAIQDCVITYPAGDSGVTDSPYSAPYPVTPSSTYQPVGNRDANEKASSIRCPGNPGGTNDHGVIFGGTTGRFFPAKPALMDDWVYKNSTGGVYIMTKTNKTDLYLQEAMQKVKATYDACEADYITDGSAPCTAGYYCLRIWVLRTTTCP